MAEFIRRRERVECESWSLCWEYTDDSGGGFSFPCDRSGNVDLSQLEAPALANYNRCMAGDPSLSGPEIDHRTWHYYEYAVIKCDTCGREVWLRADPATCECGADYNLFGQRLAHRSQWGEETGEYFGGREFDY